MPKFNVSRSITVNAPAEKVFNILNNFNTWTLWSPWLVAEPDAKVNVADNAKYYEWEGKRVGSGNMTITNEKENKSIDIDLLFLKPWKSKAKVGFKLESDGEGTKVTWNMDSALPFFMFWMKKMMVAFISMDFDRGLKMLKDYTEDGKVHSELTFKGASQFSGFQYVGVETSCSIADLEKAMTVDFEKLTKYITEHTDNLAGKPLSIYHKWDFGKGQVRYTVAIPVKDISGVDGGYSTGNLPDTPVQSIEHKGPYHHLGNPWTVLSMMARNKEFKQNKKLPSFEVYQNAPGEVAENDLLTEVYFPTK